MQNKKLVTAVAAVLVSGGAGAFIAYEFHEFARAERFAIVTLLATDYRPSSEGAR